MSGEVTRWLERMREGDSAALDRLVPLLYDELRGLAHRMLTHERPGHTLSTTALVHELYLRFLGQEKISSLDRGEFFAVAATTMRRILVDAARRRRRAKRGGGAEPVPLDEIDAFFSEPEAAELLALDLALERLRAESPRAAQVVEMRFFAGLSLEEVARALGLSEKTVRRDWLAARAWLRREIG